MTVDVPVDVDADFTPAERAREDAFHADVRPPAYGGLLAGLLVAGVLGLTPLGARVVTAAARPLPDGWGWQVVAGAAALTVVGRVVALPFAARAHAVRRDYDLTRQAWPAWALDQVRGLGVGLAFTLIAALGFYAVVRAAPVRWWLGVGLGGAALVLAGSFAFPVLVEPVFNRFASLEEGPLRTSLLALARQDGVPVRDVLVADASRRTTTLNAYVSGFGSTRRIVVYDTLLRGASPDEVRLVVAHELGHAARQDVLVGTTLGALGVVVAAAGGYLLLGSTPLLRWAGASGVGDPRSLALLVLLVSAATLVTAPLQTLISRRIEARADVHSLELTRDPVTFAASERRLALTNLSDLDPHPLVYAFFATHPTGPQRIALSRRWALRNGLEPPPPLAPGGVAAGRP